MEEIGKFGRDVFICDGNRTPLGTGVLFVPENFEYAFILTVAHLFRNDTNCSRESITLNIYSPFLRKIHKDEGRERDLGRISNVECEIWKMGETFQDDSDAVILLHSKYNPNDKASSFDIAVVRLKKETWMNEMKPLVFPEKFEERIELDGYGYPRGGNVEQLRKNGDFFAGRLPLKCCSAQYDEIRKDIEVTHDYKKQEGIELDGYSGTAIFDGKGRFYGVVSRLWGRDNDPGAFVISSWRGFDEVLQTFGLEIKNIDVSREMEIFIDLNVRGHWLLNIQNESARDLIDDREVINLASLLFGMTDAYTVILASTWKKGIASTLERMIYEFAAKNNQKREDLPFPKWKEASHLTDTAEQGEGLVVDIAASRSDLLVRIREILQRCKNKNIPLIVNVWSERPEEAISAVASVYEKSELQCMGDYISMIDDSVISKNVWYYAEESPDICLQKREDIDQQVGRHVFLTDKDYNAEHWWSLILQTAKSGFAENNLKGYRLAKSSKDAVQHWIGAQSEESIQKLFEYEIVFNLLEQDEVDELTMYLWRFIKAHPENIVIRKFFDRIKNNCSLHVTQLINVLEGQCDIQDIVDSLYPTDIQIWSELVENDNFRSSVEKIKGHNFYWIAIMRGLNGYEYVMRERITHKSGRFMSRLLNRNSQKDDDELIEAQASYIRGFLRPERNRGIIH